MPSAASVIIGRAESALNDPDNVQWTEADLIEYINDAQGVIVMMRPEANPVTGSMKLAEGTRQSIPQGTPFDLNEDGDTTDTDEASGVTAFALIEVVRNMGTNGQTPGRVVRKADRYHMDKNHPNWHQATVSGVSQTSAEVTNYIYDTRNRKTFYVYPPQPSSGQGWLEMVVSRVPKKISASTGELSMEEVYEPAILSYVMYRAFLKDIAMDEASISKSNVFYQQFMQNLGLKGEADMRMHPGQEKQVVMGERGF